MFGEVRMRRLRSLNRRIAVAVIIVLLVSVFVAPESAFASDRDSNWIADITQLAQELPSKHPNLFDKMPRSTFDSEIKALKNDVKKLQDNEIAARLTKIVAGAGDPHTSIYYRNFYYYPLVFLWLKEGIFLSQTSSDYKDALNRKLISINGKDVGQIVKMLSPYNAFENKYYQKERILRTINNADIMKSAGLIADIMKATFIFEGDNGETIDINPTTFASNSTFYIMHPTTLRKWNENPPPYAQITKNYGFICLEDKKTIYIKYSRCSEDKGYSFQQFLSGVKEQCDIKKPEKMIVDLRTNGGGSTRIFMPLIEWLTTAKELNKSDKLFVITGRRTFSAAVQNAVQLYVMTNATFTGEPSGNKPNHYGEVRGFELSNTKIYVQHSTRYMKMLTEDPDALYPDTEIEWNSEDYFNAKDTVVEAILDGKVPPTKRPGKVSSTDLSGMTRDEAWRYVIKTFPDVLEKNNPKIYANFSKEDFLASCAELSEKITTLADSEIKLGLMEIIAKFGSPQLCLDLSKDFPSFQIYFTVIDGDYYVSKIDKKYQEFCGKKLLRVDATNVLQIQDMLKRLICSQNIHDARNKTASLIRYPDVLFYLGITNVSTQANFVFEGEDGCEEELRLKLSLTKENPEFAFMPPFDLPNDKLPRSLQIGPAVEIIKDQNIVYLRSSLFDSESQKEFEAFVDKFYKSLDEAAIPNIVIDFRNHAHCAQTKENELYSNLAQKIMGNMNWRVFVLTNATSGGKAVEFASMLRNAGARIIGVPTRYKPNHNSVETSFSHLNMLHFVAPSGQELQFDERDPDSLYPDFYIPTYIWDFVSGRDKALDFVFSLTKVEVHFLGFIRLHRQTKRYLLNNLFTSMRSS